MISIQEYNDAESAYSYRLSARAIQAFSPMTFSFVGYPTRVVDEIEIARYIDVMHETKDAVYFEPPYVFSIAEGEEVKKIIDLVAQKTADHFGQTIRPWMAPLAAVQTYRIVCELSKLVNKAKCSIFEIGPGSGYLGALLVQAGLIYTSMDNTQAMYLWQSRLLDWLTNGQYAELSLEDSWQQVDSTVSHVPWWHFVKLRENTDVRVDIIVCDHALGEMTPTALHFVLKVSLWLLRGAGPKFFVYRSPGAHHGSIPEAVRQAFFDVGYRLCQGRDFYAFVPPGSDLFSGAMTRQMASGSGLVARVRRRLFHRSNSVISVPMVNHRLGMKTLVAGEILQIVENEAPWDYDFLRVVGQKTPMDVG